MRTLALALAAAFIVASVAAAGELEIGAAGPTFKLKGVDDKEHALDDYKEAKAVVVIFTCNHCPVAQAYQDRIIEIQKDYADKGAQVIAINPNSSEKVPQDSFENMKVRAEEKAFNFPYLYDETQEIAKLYGAKVTPHIFLLDGERKLAYRGRIDNSQDPLKVNTQDLRNALDAVLEGKAPEAPVTTAFGCSIKWK